MGKNQSRSPRSALISPNDFVSIGGWARLRLSNTLQVQLAVMQCEAVSIRAEHQHMLDASFGRFTWICQSFVRCRNWTKTHFVVLLTPNTPRERFSRPFSSLNGAAWWSSRLAHASKTIMLSPNIYLPPPQQQPAPRHQPALIYGSFFGDAQLLFERSEKEDD